MKKIIIFDYDGVLVDSFGIIMKTFNNSFRKNNFKELTREEFSKLFDYNFYDSLINFGMPKEKIPIILSDLNEGLSLYQNKILLFNGVKSMFKKLSKDNKIMIVAANITSIIRNCLITNNINEVDEIIGVDKETSKTKRILMVKSKYPESEIFYIGDTKGDIIEGKEAKVVTVAVTWGYHNRKKIEEANPDYIVDSPEELVELLNI